ncbi:MAG: Fe-S biogenesis protein NfuA [Gammaproteobacteria bacterium]|nr:Fe-S biogenesis protein NfuA [Gammaproteobacteria bacterium]NND39750.1 Fe-S biogenesis protein NfuA [Pseudomonadales bacterium]NNM10546.1 Fe-S biogenesis protein NfuA [Pseudomonadales bacterium]RZV51360.1 MAG: Fe-S biogenesis protein NfuA [Pseudomonadales bacterium]
MTDTPSIFAAADTQAREYVEIELTDSAQEYLKGLLESQDEDVIGIRVFINDQGTPRAETCIAYCRQEDAGDESLVREYAGFTAYFDAASWPYLDAAKIDFAEDRMGGQLTIKAPNSKMPQVRADSPLQDRINYLLYTEVNPSLASHGGEVSLMLIDDDNFAVLQFGGGCQGCAAVDATLKEGVEKTLKQHLPDLAGVKDITDHTDRSNAYY